MINYESLSSFSQVVSKLSIFIFIIAANYVGDISQMNYQNAETNATKECLSIKSQRQGFIKAGCWLRH